jgi:hypothetical protein
MKGNISISRPHSNRIEGEANSENFAYAITQSGHIPCNLTLRNIENVGKRREIKEERVPFRPTEKYGSRAERNAKLAALKPFEIDGWKGDIGKLGNWHYGDSTNGYNVTFTRFVEDNEDT